MIYLNEDTELLNVPRTWTESEAEQNRDFSNDFNNDFK